MQGERNLLMSIEIPSVASSTPSAARSAPNPAPAQPKPAQSSTHGSEDTVRLTAAQQVYQLYNHGQKISQIASALSLSVAEVNNYLNLTNGGR
jgi:DNA-binding NarL/FixJ family response regulator